MSVIACLAWVKSTPCVGASAASHQIGFFQAPPFALRLFVAVLHNGRVVIYFFFASALKEDHQEGVGLVANLLKLWPLTNGRSESTLSCTALN